MKWLAVGWLVCLMACTALADFDPPVVVEKGVCRFLLHHYDLSEKDQATINLIIADLLKEHEQAFEFVRTGNLKVQIRMFGREDDFNQFAKTNHVNGESRPSTNLSATIAGYYSGHDREVVTWRQHNPSYLANNILHECSHAIMRGQFRALPIWLTEGCAVYFEFPRYMRDDNDERQLRAKWARTRQYLDEGSLPNLHEFLNISMHDFRLQSQTRMYTLSWSVFQLLMSTPENRRAMNEMLRGYQMRTTPEPDCAKLLDAAYPGGLAKMDKDWRAWITRGALNILGPRAK